MSVGLLVDFLMHIILRYYEAEGKTREDKVKETLRTMGSSILVGGLSTCFGVIPLAFSSSAILRTVFTAFISMVTIGVGHGLILLPVLLSFLGPTACINLRNHREKDETDQVGVLHNNMESSLTSERVNAMNSPLTVRVAERSMTTPSGSLRSVKAGDTYGYNFTPTSSQGSPVLRTGGEDTILAFLEQVRMANDGKVRNGRSVTKSDAANSSLTFSLDPSVATTNEKDDRSYRNDLDSQQESKVSSPVIIPKPDGEVDV